MDSLFFHPKLVHIPIGLAVILPLVSIGIVVAWWRQWLPARAWVIVVALQAVLVLSGIAAMRSGEHEEETVEEVVPHDYIHHHEEAAERFVWSAGGLLLLMGAGLAFSNRRAGLPLAAAAAAGTIGIFVLGYQTGEAGGSLVYEHGAASAYTSGGEMLDEPPDDPAGVDDHD